MNAASELAIGALGFVAADPEQLSRFLALSGIDPAAIRSWRSPPRPALRRKRSRRRASFSPALTGSARCREGCGFVYEPHDEHGEE
jgi:hypothetical protein